MSIKSLLAESASQVNGAYYGDQRSDPQTQELARRRHMFELDYQMRMKENEKKVRAEVRAEIEAEVEAKTKAKRQADKFETARKFKLLGVDCGTIAQAMGLSLEEVEQLLN
jgi:crotonobetainyl-CoA:carnitine CoA-transferase CaiB-like acyl-CoA transferase